MFRFRYLLLAVMLMAGAGAGAEVPDSLLRHVPIAFNGAEWSGVRHALADSRNVPFTIVHIGDSHLQADWPTSHLRHYFQQAYGDAGRGLVTPFKMSGSYQAKDYSITSPNTWKAAKFLKAKWTPEMTFSGTALSTAASKAKVTVTCDGRPFNDIVMYHAGEVTVTSVTDASGREIEIETETEPGEWTAMSLDELTPQVTITMEPGEGFVLGSFNVTNGNPGVLYHTIGNGGADIHQYNRIKGLGQGVAELGPDLIILALGTNDSYNYFTLEKFATNLDKIVNELRDNNPGVALLLVTPMEIMIGEIGRGKSITPGCATIHEMMLDYAARNHIALYDWYEATGGHGAAAGWVKNKLMRTDRVHLTPAGYKAHADALYRALIEALE